MNYIEGDWPFDTETYPNVFTFCTVYANGKGLRVFEISNRKNDTEQLLDFLRKVKNAKHRLVGFHNLGFDYPIVHYILTKAKQCKQNGSKLLLTAQEIYKVAESLIKSQNDEKFKNQIKPSEVIIPQVDLFKIHHFDNKAKATSLKMLEFNMRSENIEDLPFPVGKILSDGEIDVLIEYNKHDVMETLKFYVKSLEAIRFRALLSEKYGFDCTNYNDTKIGKEYFINRLEKAIPGSCYKKTAFGKKINQTIRDEIRIKDVIFPYVKFERPELSCLLDWFKAQTITETKGVFTDILESNLGPLAQYCELKEKRKKQLEYPSEIPPLHWIEEVELKSKKDTKSIWLHWKIAETLNVLIDGFRLDFGTGGLHGSLENQIVVSDDEYLIVDLDVASYYPNMAISNRVYPKHLTEKFCDIYKDVYEERKIHKKGTPENGVMKLALNGIYGDSNNQFSPFYDPQYTMSITINGQLLLCMLIEQLLKIESLLLVQCNTDGITVRLKREQLDELNSFVKEWEILTKLEMETNFYSKMIIRDCNNYIAVFENGKVKRKGCYEYENLGWHQNQSALVVQMAVEHELLNKGKAEEFIRSHKEKFDFMLRTKVPRNSRLVIVKNEEDIPQQNICRYYPSKEGGKLIKIMPPLEGKEEAGERRLGIDTSWDVKTCNDINDFKWDMNYDYYISEARKLIDIYYEEK